MKKEHHLSEVTREKMRKAHLGIPRSEETKRKMSLHLKGRKAWNKGSVGYMAGEKHYNWKGGTAECEVCNKTLSGHKVKYCIYHRPKLLGINNPFWKGGVTPKNRSIRTSAEYVLWRTAVFKRDSYTCIWCGQSGIELEADHIKPFSLYPELRFAIDNGRTLCKDCHTKTDTYGGRANQ